MGFFDRIQNSWNLVKLSWNLLMQDKKLLLFPIISTIAAILLFIGIVMPSVLTGTNDISIGYLILWYFTTGFVTIFMNAALFACVKMRLHGGQPTIGYGIKQASKRIVSILIWSLITTTVGLILRWLENLAAEREDIMGLVFQIIIGMIGAAWSLITMFVIPALVVEDMGVWQAMKRSAVLFKKTWGENAIADIGLGVAFFVLYIIGIAVGLIALFLIGGTIGLIMLVIVIAYLAVVAIFESTLEQVFNAVLYSYAVGDNVPLAFKQNVNNAFKQKQKSR